MGLIVDLFAGGGGASTGIEWATGRSPDIAINHDPLALAMHAANHPNTKHLVENVWKVRPREIVGAKTVDILWASPDCTHFSKAKGQAPNRDPNRAKRSRGLAWVIWHWAREVRPTKIFMENVEEWIDWGPLLADGRPDPKRKGETRKRFVRKMVKLGYAYKIFKSRACSYGAPTIRQRLFGVFTCDGEPINDAVVTHRPKSVGADDLFTASLPFYRTAAEIIDWDTPCPSIFTRKKELAPATKRRIARGMKRYVIDAAQPFIVSLTHHGIDGAYGLDQPLNTVTGAHRGEKALVSPYVMGITHSSDEGARSHRADEPLRTVTTAKRGEQAIVTPYLVGTAHGEGQGRGKGDWSLEDPIGTVTASGDRALVAPILTGVGGPTYSGKPRPVDAPFGTVLNENHSGVAVGFLAGCGGRAGQSPERSVDGPVGTITSKADQILVAPTLVKYHSAKRHGDDRVGQLTDPLPTQTTENRFGIASAFLAQHNTQRVDVHPGRAVDAPVSTVTTTGSHQSLVAAHLTGFYTSNTNGGEGDPRKPLKTVTAGGQHLGLSQAFLTKYYSEGGTDQPIDDPLHTITTKARLSLVTTAAGTFPMDDDERYAAWWVARFIEEHLAEPTIAERRAVARKKLRKSARGYKVVTVVWTHGDNDNIPKEREAFVCAAGIPIVDIGMRMLLLRELFRAQGFPDSYVIAPVVTRKVAKRMVTGPLPKTDGTRMCGNSVSPYQAAAYLRANPIKPKRMRRAA